MNTYQILVNRRTKYDNIRVFPQGFKMSVQGIHLCGVKGPFIKI